MSIFVFMRSHGWFNSQHFRSIFYNSLIANMTMRVRIPLSPPYRVYKTISYKMKNAVLRQNWTEYDYETQHFRSILKSHFKQFLQRILTTLYYKQSLPNCSLPSMEQPDLKILCVNHSPIVSWVRPVAPPFSRPIWLKHDWAMESFFKPINLFSLALVNSAVQMI